MTLQYGYGHERWCMPEARREEAREEAIAELVLYSFLYSGLTASLMTYSYTEVRTDGDYLRDLPQVLYVIDGHYWSRHLWECSSV